MKPLPNMALLLALLISLTAGCQPAPTWFTSHDARRITAVVKAEIAKGSFPGAVVLIGRDENILYEKAFGHQAIQPRRVPMRTDTVFDLASLTKPVATAPAVMLLADRGKIDINDYAAKYLPAFASEGKQHVRISHLLTHTSGLPAYTNADSLAEQFGSPCPHRVIDKICSLKALSEPGREFRYSCLGYITLARIVEIVASTTIDQFTQANIFTPLKMSRTTYNPPDSWKHNIAATEILDAGPLRGTVHDPLARLMDGKSGNAGLFSTARDLSLYCRMLLNSGTLNGTTVLSPEAVAMLTRPRSHGRACGFDLESTYAWIKGSHAPPEAFCHSGYTGTSIVCDPTTKTYIIILTNRPHPRDNGSTKTVRTKIADIVFQASAKHR
jgi:CubicO group peptidase (beta-lactamase class C family)